MKKSFIKTTVIILCFCFLLAGNSLASDPNSEPNDVNSLPANFPSITTHIYDSNLVGDGYIYLAVASEVEGVGYYLLVLKNDGTPVYYKELEDDYAYDFKVQPNGLMSYAHLFKHHDYSGGGDAIHKIMNSDCNQIDSFEMKNGYVPEGHDFQILPNGHALLIGYYMSQMDLSQIVNGGYPNAMVSGGIVQELDVFKNVVFQWRTWDYYNPEDVSWGKGSKQPVVSQFHLNTVNMDDDGNIFIATPEWVKKINRQTGDIMWNLGGDDNEFTFIGVDQEEGESHFGGHAFHRIPNGNVLIYDNGNRPGTRSSQVHEYKLDEPNRTAELVWEYEPDPGIYGWHRGNAQRLPNGNTFIGWGGSNGKPGPACSEVTPDGNCVFELFFDPPEVESYRAFRLPFPAEVPAIEVEQYEVATGNTYEFKDNEKDTGVTMKVLYRDGEGYNEVSVRREPFAPLYPEFPGTAPRVLPERVIISQYAITALTAQISFDVNSFDFDDPNIITVYHRPYRDVGLFIPLQTVYNYATGKVRATVYSQTGYSDDVGEFIFAYPDLEHTKNAPILIEPKEQVNQELPVSFSWSPKGIINKSHLQISTDPNYTTLLVDEKNLLECIYTLETTEPNTTYYWRVSTINNAGESSWSESTFDTVPPMINVNVPNDGEQWHKGVEYFIQWNDNIDEDVVIELYKGDTYLQEIAIAPSNSAYLWEVDLSLQTGDDYKINIRSSVDGSIADMSDNMFSIKN